MDNRDIVKRMRDARIPPQSLNCTLETLGQTRLRSIIMDRTYVSQGILKTFAIREPESTQDSSVFSRVIGRFAAELVMSGVQVLYAQQSMIYQELMQRRAYFDHEASLTPVMSHFGQGFLVIPDLPECDPSRTAVCDFLLEHVAAGGGLVLGLRVIPGREPSYRKMTADMAAAIQHAFVSVDVQPVRRSV